MTARCYACGKKIRLKKVSIRGEKLLRGECCYINFAPCDSNGFSDNAIDFMSACSGIPRTTMYNAAKEMTEKGVQVGYMVFQKITEERPAVLYPFGYSYTGIFKDYVYRYQPEREINREKLIEFVKRMAMMDEEATKVDDCTEVCGEVYQAEE